MIRNLMLPEDAILEVLSNAMNGWMVLPLPDNASAITFAQNAPAIYVWSQPIDGPVASGHGSITQISQSYTAILAVRNVSDLRSGKAARMLAGEAAITVITALTGLRPTKEWYPLELSTTQYPPTYTDGVYLLPITFSTTVTITNIRKNT